MVDGGDTQGDDGDGVAVGEKKKARDPSSLSAQNNLEAAGWGFYY